MSELVENPLCVRDGHATAKWYPVIGWTCERCGLEVPEPFYAPGYQYEVAVAGATDVLTQKINAFPLLLAVAKAMDETSINDDGYTDGLGRVDEAMDALNAAHPDWRTWTP